VRAEDRTFAIPEVLEQSVRMRTRPILMTGACTVLGMLPVAAERAVGLERLSPPAVVAISGLAVSTVLTLVYVPIFYSLFDSVKKRVAGRISRKGD
jgi:multidrug efflux pump subunit AcrB